MYQKGCYLIPHEAAGSVPGRMGTSSIQKYITELVGTGVVLRSVGI
jgi:hypothetical protein